MAKYQKYAEYKDSGIEWLGEIPSHWDVKRLGSFFEERREKVSDVDYPALSVTKNGIVPQLDTAAKTDAGDNRKLVKVNDFVINSRSDRKGSSGISPYTGSVSLISIVMEPHRIYPAYAHHLLRSYPFQEEFYRYGKGIVADLWSTNSSEMKNILLPDIPIIEQQKIASFLEHETAKIDTLIAKQEKLIELLKEKRQAVISHAVTKGLNPNVQMKDSGVEWLGEVPEHWIVIKLKHLTTLFEQGWSPQCDSRTAEPHEYGILKVGCVNGGKFRALENKALPSELEPRLQYLIQKNDLLISRANTKELVGSAAVIDEDYPNLILCDKLYRLRFTRAVSAEMVALYLSIGVVREQIELSATGASHSMQNIGQDTIKELFYLLPPIDEAHNILKDIAESNTKFDSLISKAGSAIQLMQERRTALISAAVTGKIDVRNWQNPNQKSNNHTELSA
ncbi:restriction endonuclease subunit S [Acinetobacter haemolyticus]|uniref:Type I restriction endonuclease subunit S n=1 Tax=Acinetobacter haemolyticus TaxID=29430 RepID=A0AAJ2YTW8_ACIHA|nr:type I restriction endonuclease subunit S [Acinetobacter haemolyticus]NAR48580.1 type I restriction endonuclease subunit S [Acinetobacter haemolyticus]NAR63454.1 type I restriction endonuclease subunit S [Acinetobacter haemolyticus]NAR73402.1 type I restriction endonuclease subunit S [Acinetobacter haemolyticus]